MDSVIDLYDTYWKRLNKRIQGKPEPVQVLQKRTLNSAIVILENLKEIPFQKLSTSLYFYCQDIQMSKFTRLYEAQIELAGANPEKFVFQLHSFYNDISSKIKKGNLYSEFFEFYYRCVRQRQANENKAIQDNVIIAYLNLLTQNIEYLRPSKFDFNTCVVGLSTTGELLVGKDNYPTLDLPSYELQHSIEKSKGNKQKEYSLEDVFALYRKYGYNVRSMDDLQIITNVDKIQTTTIAAILPFINEYTYDILPQEPFSAIILGIDKAKTTVDLDTLKQHLTKRKRTLPTNGVEIHFKDTPTFKQLLLKELLFDNRIFLLYRFSTCEGDLAGYYDTRDSFFYTIINEYKEDPQIAKSITTLILYLYAIYVLNNDKYSIASLSKDFTIKGSPNFEVEGFLKGGKLKNTYREEEPIEHTGKARIGNDEFEKETKAIQGFIRKLPVGQTASREAVEYAEALGYFLESNETFVRPFMKQVFKLKENT